MRLDLFIVEHGYTTSRTDAKKFITGGSVTVNGKVVTKPSFPVEAAIHDVAVDTSSKKYVSRGGLKLEHALDKFNIIVKDRLALDVGASSGGFTDCMLKQGATHVIAVDSGTGQLSSELIGDNRITLIENFNARYMQPKDLPYAPDVVVMDVSFISAKLILPSVYDCLSCDGDFICLVKPQFEVGRTGIGKNGIVKDEKLRKKALESVIEFGEALGFSFKDSVRSPIEGGDGNVEFLVHFRKENKP